MFYRVGDLSLYPNENTDLLSVKAAKELGVSRNDILSLSIYRRSLDARKGEPLYRFSVDVTVDKKAKVRNSKNVQVIKEKYFYKIPRVFPTEKRPIVVGFGPSGMFAALVLARAGFCPVVVERGKPVEERERDVNLFFSTRNLNTESNIQFGEGGAGTFSDGKLNTLLKDKNQRGRFVLEEFVKFGAPEEILYLNKPHIGTDHLKLVVKNLRQEIIRLGGLVLFETRFLEPVLVEGRVVAAKVLRDDKEEVLMTDAIFLGIGHSARDTFRSLYHLGLKMEKKIFSVGVRIEHLQKKINDVQYGKWQEKYALPTADYKLSCKTSNGKILYTFCMCPGGVVVPATSETGSVVTNGMSNFARDGVNSNSALLFNILPEELGDDVLSGFEYQNSLEKKAFSLGGGNYSAPVQLVGDFLKGERSASLGSVVPSYVIGTEMSDFSNLFTEEQCSVLKEGISSMGEKFSGFDDYDAVLTGIESRATCPVRILRDDTYQANFSGLYPIGEGAGYAGGIMSSAMDGMRSVEAYFALLKGEDHV